MRFVALVFLVALCLCGCTSQSFSGGKIVEGTDISVGIALPASEGTWQIELFNYLSGFRFGFAKDTKVECVYTMKAVTSFAGIYDNTTEKTVHAILTPTVAEEADGMTETTDTGDGGADGNDGAADTPKSGGADDGSDDSKETAETNS